MSKFIKALCLTLFLCVAAAAQNQSTNQLPTQTDEYKKNEYYVGFSTQRLEGNGFRMANGFEASYVRNVHRYFGIKGDFSAAYRNDRYDIAYSDATGNFSYRVKTGRSSYNFLGGVQVKDNASNARFKPFAHALAGVNVARFKNSAITCNSGNCPANFLLPAATFTDTSFTLAAGGGLDIKINDKIDFRAIQVDYNPVFRGGYREDNMRFGIGIVFK